MDILWTILEWVLPVLATILTVVLAVLAKRWIEKLGVERSAKVDDMIDRYVEMGVDAAERAAKTYLAANNASLPGSAKKAKAVKTVLNELEQSGIKGVAEELISDRIESWLEVKEESPKVGNTGEKA